MEYSKKIDSEAINLFLNEVKDIQQDVEYFEEEQVVLDEIEQAADFLQKVGLSNLSEIYQQGCEISESVVNATVSQRNLTLKQVQTIKSRVQTLNKTLRSHQPRQKQRQDVRDVTWNVETSGTDAKTNDEGIHFLDSSNDTGDINLNEQQSSSLPYISHDSSNFPLRNKSKWSADDQLQSKGFTTNAKYDKGDIARLLSDTVVLKGYHPIQESSFVSNVHKERGSTSQENEMLKSDNSKTNNSTNSNYSKSISDNTSNSNIVKISDKILSFESFIQKSGENSNGLKAWRSQDDVHIENLSIDDISESEYQYLRPFLWVEVTALFDQCNTTIIKRKANIKNKRGNVFGVNLSTLIMRDMPRTTDISMVPEIFKIIINHLLTRSLKEDGILRIGGQKQKLEKLCAEIESKFYENKQYIENLLQQATSHEIVGVLKKLLRDLPDPIFTMELFDMFYKCNSVLPKHAQFKALNILILLLPVEHRNTFRLLLNFLINVIKHEKENHMSLHNVAMVAAPSFFPPKLLLPKESKIQIKNVLKEDIEKHINDAAVCCCIMEMLLKYGDSLWTVPIDLVNQAREAQKRVQNRKDKKDYGKRNVRKELQRSSTQYQPNIISPRAKRDIFL